MLHVGGGLGSLARAPRELLAQGGNVRALRVHRFLRVGGLAAYGPKFLRTRDEIRTGVWQMLNGPFSDVSQPTLAT